MNEISRRRTRATGTTVAIVDNRDGSFDADDLPWFTVCIDHGGVCSHPTRKLAESWAPIPDQWCRTCQAKAGRNLDDLRCPTCGGELDWMAGDGMACCIQCGDETDLDTLTD